MSDLIVSTPFIENVAGLLRLAAPPLTFDGALASGNGSAETGLASPAVARALAESSALRAERAILCGTALSTLGDDAAMAGADMAAADDGLSRSPSVMR